MLLKSNLLKPLLQLLLSLLTIPNEDEEDDSENEDELNSIQSVAGQVGENFLLLSLTGKPSFENGRSSTKNSREIVL